MEWLIKAKRLLESDEQQAVREANWQGSDHS